MLPALILPLLGVLPAPPPQADEATRPRLIVLISVDQLIPDQLVRLRDRFRGGYRRLLEQGRFHPNGLLGHAATETGPGHAALGTGVHPSRNGIVGNGWLAPDGSTTYCVGDPEASGVTPAGIAAAPGSSSPANLLTPGFADHLRAASPASKSVGISFKDRSAILSTGRRADLALWWSQSRVGFVSSSWYGDALPDWVLELDEDWPFLLMDDAEAFDGERVTWHSSLPDDVADLGTAPDDRPGEGGGLGGVVFPHPGPTLSVPPGGDELDRLARWVYGTSYCDRLVIEAGARAVEAMELGADEHPDLLFLGLSACDSVGHTFGPYSHEVTDVMLRDDVWLGELFELLDERVGTDGWVLGLSADHGVLPLPEHLAELGHDAGRIAPGTLASLFGTLRSELADVFGSDLVLAANGSAIRLDEARMEEAGLDPAEVRGFAAEALRAGTDALDRAYTREELEAEGDDPLLLPMRRSYHPERSGDLELVVRRGWLIYPTGTSHGSPYDYDRRVPLLFMGPGIEAGTSHATCLTVDVLPTLLDAAGVPVPDGLDGRVLR